MLSTQAIVLAICNTVILVAVILSMFVIKKNTDEGNKVYATIKNIFALLMFIIIMMMQIYSLNCMVYGDCRMWAWVLAIFAVVGTLSYIGFFAYIVFTMKKISTYPKVMSTMEVNETSSVKPVAQVTTTTPPANPTNVPSEKRTPPQP
jgi:hypothetical protein